KERIPETTKERTPETIKERIPETLKERFETLIENIGYPGPRGLQPPVLRSRFGDQVPFAVATPHAGSPEAYEAQTCPTCGSLLDGGAEMAAGSGNEELAARVEQLELLVAALVAAHDEGLQGQQ